MKTTHDPDRPAESSVESGPIAAGSPMRPLVEPTDPQADSASAHGHGDPREAESVVAPSLHTFKILVTGPFAAGKTSLIQSVSQTAVVSTDVVTSGDESDVKSHTTVAMDFGTYRLPDEGISLLLFGTPGQPRFRFMTNILKGDVDVVAFVVTAEARQTHAACGRRAPLAAAVRPAGPRGHRRQPPQGAGRGRASCTFPRRARRRAGRPVPARQSCFGAQRDHRDPADAARRPRGN